MSPQNITGMKRKSSLIKREGYLVKYLNYVILFNVPQTQSTTLNPPKGKSCDWYNKKQRFRLNQCRILGTGEVLHCTLSHKFFYTWDVPLPLSFTIPFEFSSASCFTNCFMCTPFSRTVKCAANNIHHDPILSQASTLIRNTTV